MHQSPFQYANWIASTLAMMVILVAMIRRRLVGEYQLFFWYTAAHVIESFLLFAANQVSYTAYWFVYWGWEIVDAFLTLIVIQSVFVKVFDSYQTLKGFGAALFRWVTVVLCVFAIVSAMYAPANGAADHVFAGLMVMERSIQLIQLGLLLCLLLCSRLFGLPWRHYIYGIILGFGVYASVALVNWALQAQVGPKYMVISDWLFALSYSLGVFTWAYYFLSQKTVEVSAKPPNSAQLQAWNESLAAILRR